MSNDIVENIIIEYVNSEETKQDKIYLLNEIRELLERIEDEINEVGTDE